MLVLPLGPPAANTFALVGGTRTGGVPAVVGMCICADKLLRGGWISWIYPRRPDLVRAALEYE